jgi:hypothetical protein
MYKYEESGWIFHPLPNMVMIGSLVAGSARRCCEMDFGRNSEKVLINQINL